ncbi:prephenate dehydrogenase (NADP(+)) [Ascoidea rubescens DSM 1968]|uniref:Prephenate dehydrogenase [NADP(+)] n=1 Tax=Ascoidea rubescens DSM 1968 TaxID=1344418 RepID=A0A1D2VE65_9ASCO|nr:Prephenate dehydrogenase [Ascoidea rubescens DSM 1968]ODV59810.1 Prephenate dehydrogenase [Ascoidea rubescens DSM 1968]
MANAAQLEEIKKLQESKTIGIIGLGDMGLLYAKKFSNAGWKVVGCDREENFDRFVETHKNERFKVLRNGHFVSRVSDYIIYSVEAENIDKIVSLYGPSSKFDSIVGGQTSCKAPEIEAFEKYLPDDINIISVHSLHGPGVTTTGQPLVIINHRSNPENFRFVNLLMSCLNSKVVYLSAVEHDKITADTQAVTHAAFLSMGVAWRKIQVYPWYHQRWVGGIENVKINISMRIYGNKWHVYAGLAITNPSAHDQILQYANSVTELFTLMIQGDKEKLRQNLYIARDKIFGHIIKTKQELLLDDKLLAQYSLSKVPPGPKKSNSHLSLLAIVYSWYKLDLFPYDHIICSTPLFRIFLGVTEYLFCTPNLLDECIEDAITETSFRSDDLEFVIAARNWSRIVRHKSFELYQKEFEKTQDFFKDNQDEANKIGNEMFRVILQRVKEYESDQSDIDP